MDPSKAQRLAGQEMISDEELSKELEQRNHDDLCEMGRRLEASTANMGSLLDDLQTDKVALEGENRQLKETIELMMRELRKLNISSSNTVEPMLAGGDNPLSALGRWWEKVRPRDTAVQIDEHTGELRKEEDAPKNPLLQGAEEFGNQFSDQVGQRTQEFGQMTQEAQQKAQEVSQRAQEASREALAKLQTMEFVQLTQEAQQKAQEVGQRAQEASREALAKLQTSVGPAGFLWKTGEGICKAIGVVGASGTETQRPRKKKKAKQVVTRDETPTSSGQDSIDSIEAAEEISSSAPSDPEQEQVAPAVVPATIQPDLKSAAAEEQISSTILIEAQLRFDDGSVQPLSVRAADRAKDVSGRFIQEHSLKAWFQDPLTKWLKQVEEDAEHFPVQVEADLEEIRKKYSKKAA